MPVDAPTTAVRIAIVGDFQPDHETHPATGAALDHAADALGLDLDHRWVPTPDPEGRAAQELGGTDGIWIAPGSPYASLQGALDSITFARTTGVPLLGTCAGFQHIVLEVGRSVLGLAGAGHEEVDPDAPELMIAALACSLAGQTFRVSFAAGSRAAAAYGVAAADERYYCRFGLNPDFIEPLAGAGLVVTGTDHDGDPRIVEWSDHPFLVGTLFVPQVRSAPGTPHPLVRAFVAAAAGHAGVGVHAATSPPITR